MTTSAWSPLLAAYVMEQRARGLRPETIRTRMSYLRRFAAEHDPVVTRDMVITWLARASWAPSTRKSARGALRSFYKWAHRSGRIETDPTADLDPVRVPVSLPRPASEDQVKAGLGADCPHAALMVRLAAQAGLRRSEIAQLRREHLQSDGKLLIHGKGGRQRLIPLNPVLRAEIAAYPPG